MGAARRLARVGGPNPWSRILSMYRGEGMPSFDARLHSRWVGLDERRTIMEALREGEWLVVSKTVHHRRKRSEPSGRRGLEARDEWRMRGHPHPRGLVVARSP